MACAYFTQSLVRFVAAVTVGSRNTRYRAARYGLTRTGLSPVGLHQLWLALSEIQASQRIPADTQAGRRSLGIWLPCID